MFEFKGGAAHRLTPAEQALLAQLASGRGMAEAAKTLGITVKTARNRAQNAKEKFDAPTVLEAVKIFTEKGIS